MRRPPAVLVLSAAVLVVAAILLPGCDTGNATRTRRSQPGGEPKTFPADRVVDRYQSAGRQRLIDLIERSEALVTDRTPWVPDRVQVLQIAPGALDAGPGASDEPAHPWPGASFTSFLTEPGRANISACGVPTGDDARAVARADARAVGFGWDDHGDVRSLVMRHLLPHEQPCAR